MRPESDADDIYPQAPMLLWHQQIARHDDRLDDHERRITAQEIGMADMRSEIRHVASHVAEIRDAVKGAAQAQDVQEIKDGLQWIRRLLIGTALTATISAVATIVIAVGLDKLT